MKQLHGSRTKSSGSFETNAISIMLVLVLGFWGYLWIFQPKIFMNRPEPIKLVKADWRCDVWTYVGDEIECIKYTKKGVYDKMFGFGLRDYDLPKGEPVQPKK